MKRSKKTRHGAMPDPSKPTGPVTRRIVLKVAFPTSLAPSAAAPIPVRALLSASAPAANLDRFSKAFPGLKVAPLFKGVATNANVQRSRELLVEPQHPLPRLDSFFVVECPADADPTELAKALSEMPGIETAYVEGGPTPPPTVNPADDPRFANQGYLDAAPDGIDAQYAWTLPGGDGAGIGFVDLEQGWTLNHEDLVAANISVISGTNQAYFGHGTAVLGEILAGDNAVGCVGIVPKVTARVVSQYRSATTYSTAEAIHSAAAAMTFGDVLLLEAQTSVSGYPGYLPVEVEPAVFEAIRFATALGIVVVEAGGNGSIDLDTFSDANGKRVLDRSSADFRDSGAVMVGAASSAAPHQRLGFSNYGSRIDCYGWGADIDTTGDGWTGNLTDSYTSYFGGTSGASPIVSGAAIAVQGVAAITLGRRFSPGQLRDLLRDPATGTPAADPSTDRIGVMPNLRAILDGALALAPDVYARDHIGDTGAPHAGPVSSSPDIVLLRQPVPDPQASFGAGSGTENSDMLGSEAEGGQDNVLYIRVRNRGGTDATDVKAKVFWSPVATLVTPDLWTPVGEVTLPVVPAGDSLTVSQSIVWPAASIPGSGHYCFVALVGNSADPAPDPVDLLNWDNFIRFIRENNSITWRNFNVVDNEPQPPGKTVPPPGFVRLPFLSPGTPDRSRDMRLEVVARLPKGAKLLLEAPKAFAKRSGFWSDNVFNSPRSGYVCMPLSRSGSSTSKEINFRAKSRTPLALFVRMPKERRGVPYDLVVRQLYRTQEVGRVTWRLVPKRKS